MKYKGYLFLCLTFMLHMGGVHATSEGEKYQVAGDPAEAQKLFSQIEGVYKHFNTVEFINPSPPARYEEILEIVPINEVGVYVKIRTWFTNAHKCAYEGVFEYKASKEFIAVTEAYPGAGACVLKLDISKDKVKFHELSPASSFACQSYCGSRGSLTATDFDHKSKRRIRYLARLKSSDEYIEEVRDYKERFKRD